MVIKGVRLPGESRIQIPQEKIAESDSNRNYGRPVESFKAELDLLVAGGNIPHVPDAVRKHIEGLMAAEGRRLSAKLPDAWRGHLNYAIEAYRSAGYSRRDLEGLRFAVAQKLSQRLSV